MMHLLADSEVLRSSYFFGRPAWIPWMLLLGAILFALSLVSYRQSPMPVGSRCLALLFRTLGICLLLVCLLEPMGVQEKAKPHANAFAVLVDNSQSTREIWQARGREALQNEPTSSATAEQWYREMLSDKADWARNLSEDFRVRRYVFAESLEPIDSFEGIQQTGVDSALVGSLLDLKDRYQVVNEDQSSARSGFPLAGVMVFTDGQATDKARLDSLKSLGVPVYPVLCGSVRNHKDISISAVSVRQSNFETAPTTFKATVQTFGPRIPEIEVDLIDESNQVVATKPARFEKQETSTNVEFQFRPKKPGVQGYRVVARPKKSDKLTVANADDDRAPSLQDAELTMLNNQRFQIVDRGRGPYRVLYIAGRPNWEFKFLSRALSEDEEIDLTALIRIARKEPKFSFRDNRVDSANPLFSGFEDISDEEKEQFDQPVFVRLGIAKQGDLQPSFPKDLDELFAYQAVILDDLEHTFFTQEQQSMLRQFVTIRGGGLMALGGKESMRGKDFSTSVLSQLLPIYGESTDLDPQSLTTNPNQVEPMAIRMSLTREGWLQPFMRLADNEAGEKERLEKMPAFQVLNRTKQLKPGASVLSEGKLGDEVAPILVTQKYGRGQSAAFLLGDWWRWAMNRQGNEPSPLFQAWRQLVRWLISDVPRSIDLRVESVDNAHRLRRLVLDLKGSDFQVVDNASVTVKVSNPNRSEMEWILEPSADTPGRYETTINCDEQGVYTAEATCIGPDGSPLGSRQCGWVYEPLSIELQSMGEDQEFLEELAAATGGKTIGLSALNSFTTNIPSQQIPIREKRIYPLWHNSWMILAALTCLCVEWGWRRRYGMA